MIWVFCCSWFPPIFNLSWNNGFYFLEQNEIDKMTQSFIEQLGPQEKSHKIRVKKICKPTETVWTLLS